MDIKTFGELYTHLDKNGLYREADNTFLLNFY
jgi:hypothetical protein